MRSFFFWDTDSNFHTLLFSKQVNQQFHIFFFFILHFKVFWSLIRLFCSSFYSSFYCDLLYFNFFLLHIYSIVYIIIFHSKCKCISGFLHVIVLKLEEHQHQDRISRCDCYRNRAVGIMTMSNCWWPSSGRPQIIKPPSCWLFKQVISISLAQDEFIL